MDIILQFSGSPDDCPKQSLLSYVSLIIFKIYGSIIAQSKFRYIELALQIKVNLE